MRAIAGLLTALAAAASPARAVTPANAGLVCEPPAPQLDRYAYLRALSLDLRGVIPTVEEYAALDGLADVPEATIDAWLASEQFVGRAVRRHNDLLWPNVTNLSIGSLRWQIGGSPAFRSQHATTYRGGPDRVGCLDEPATFTPEGEIMTRVVDGHPREGWVMVRPYWAPTTSIKVCAFDAQEADVSPTGIDCRSLAGQNDTKCGCGPNLMSCWGGDSNAAITMAFAEDEQRRVAAHIRENRPYSELLTGRRAFVNGPLVHFWKYLATSGAYNFLPSPMPSELPPLTYMDKNTWVEITLPESHAGVLTSPAFLLRFQTNRARANRFYNSFLCQPFQPPPGGIPAPTSAEAREPDLQIRAGCKYCHAILEPSASYWGRWGTVGTSYLPPEQFPAHRADCDTCAHGGACTTECRSYYLTKSYSAKEDAYLGVLNPYAFRRPEHQRNVEEGPKLLVLEAIAENRLPACVARRTAEVHLGRRLGLDEEGWATDLSSSFVRDGMSYRALVKNIVMSPVYRRVR